MKFLEELAAMRRFGMRPGLDAIRCACAALGDPQKGFRAIHVAGTNGKGAVCAILDAVLREGGTAAAKAMAVEPGNGGLRIGRYTSPHLVKLNERFFLDGEPIDDATLECAANRVSEIIQAHDSQLTFFEALTAVAFLIYSEAKVDYAILETGLGGRLDATNICEPCLCVITRIGLDHCDWLGDTVEKIAAEKAGIIKPGVPVVLGANAPGVRMVVEARAKKVGAPFYYAPDLAAEGEIPDGFSLAGAFNRENAVTAIAALKVLGSLRVNWGRLGSSELARVDLGRIVSSEPLGNDLGRLGSAELDRGDFGKGFSKVLWPGRFQVVGNFIVDGAHNPPAARALAAALDGYGKGSTFNLIAGFCGDKDVAEVLSILAPFVKKGYAVRTNNPRSLSAEETATKMREAGIDAVACASLNEAINNVGMRDAHLCQKGEDVPPTAIICGSLFLAGEALVELGAYPWSATRFDASELLRT